MESVAKNAWPGGNARGTLGPARQGVSSIILLKKLRCTEVQSLAWATEWGFESSLSGSKAAAWSQAPYVHDVVGAPLGCAVHSLCHCTQ